MRNIKELLEVLLSFYSKEEITWGLCKATSDIWSKKIISLYEYKLLEEYIDKHPTFLYRVGDNFKYLSNFTPFPYYWETGEEEPRIKWLKKHIKRNS